MPIKISESKDRMRDFLDKKFIGVLATCGKSGQPHAAAVYIIHDKELNIYFITKAGTQKGENLSVNPKAALAVYDEASQTTLQATGLVSNIEDAADANHVFSEILKVSLEISKADPPVSKLLDGGYQACKFTPSSIRLASYQHPPEGDWQNIFLTVE